MSKKNRARLETNLSTLPRALTAPDAVKAGMFSNYSQWWLAGSSDLSTLMGAALIFSDSAQGRINAATYNVWAANCIAARSETLAGVDLKLYKTASTPEEDDEEIVDHPILELLSEVNPINLDKTSFREQVERQLSIHGECYIHKVRGAKGEPAELYILPSQLVEPIPDSVRLVAGYKYQTSIVIQPDDIIRVYYPSDENPVNARSPLTSAVNAINNYSLSDLSQQGIDRRGGQGGGIVMVDFNAMLGDPQRFMQEWDAKRSDPRNAGRDAFLPVDSNYQSGTLTAQQQQREERNTRLIREIMAAFRVPPSLAGDYKDASVLANAAQQSRNFWETFMLFELKRVEDAFNYHLLWKDYKGSKDEGLYLAHDVEEIAALSDGKDAEVTRENMAATTADLSFNGGIITLNEARIDIGKDPVDDPRADEIPALSMAEEVDPLTGEPIDPMAEEPAPDIAAEDPELDSLLAEAEAVKARDMDGDGMVFDGTKQERPATASEKVKGAGSRPSKAQGMLDKAKARQAKKLAKKKGKGGKAKKPKLTDEQKAAAKDKKHAAKVAAQVAQIEQYENELSAELKRLTDKKDFKDESNLRKRITNKLKQLANKKKRLQEGKSNADAGAEDMLSEAATKALEEPYMDSTWVGFYLSTHDAMALEDENLEELGECEDRLHMTMAMLRPVSYEERAQIVSQLSDIAKAFKPITVQTDGADVFYGGDNNVLHVKVTGNDIFVLRTALEQALKPYLLDSDYAFTPHITLCYMPSETDSEAVKLTTDVPNIQMQLPVMTFAESTFNWNFSLGYGYVGVQNWAEAVEDEEEEEEDEEDEEGMPPAKASYRPVRFFDVVGQKAMVKTDAGRVFGTIEQVKRFGEYEGLKATKDDPVVWVNGTPVQSSEVELLLQ